MFSHVEETETHGNMTIHLIEVIVATHLFPSSATNVAELRLTSKACRLTTLLIDKAYTSAGEAAFALPTMALLQVFQAKLLQSLESCDMNKDTVKDLCTMTQH